MPGPAQSGRKGLFCDVPRWGGQGPFSVIPLWKARREMHRLGEHIWALAGLFYEPVLKWRHDRWRDGLAEPLDFAVPLGRKVAVCLVFQPKGIAPSFLATLRYLGDAGYAALIISNAPLSPDNRATLAPLVWRIVERPNFGYDFGGYRDGILLLRQWGVAVDRMIVMNDSIWMPLRAGSTLIARLEAASGDVVGGFLHPDSQRRRGGTLRRGFVESYLYLINGRALQSPAFWKFWDRYRVSSNKLNAVYRGERGFSHAMRDAGLEVAGLFSPDKLRDALKGQDDAFLRQVLVYAAYTDADLLGESMALLHRPGDPSWRAEALSHIDRTITRRRFNAAFPYPCDDLLGMDFIKKSAGPSGAGSVSLHSQMRRQVLRAVGNADLAPLCPDVLAEMTALEGRFDVPLPAVPDDGMTGR